MTARKQNMKKTVRKLTKKEMNKIRGGREKCIDTQCLSATCNMERSEDYCRSGAGSTDKTVSIAQ